VPLVKPEVDKHPGFIVLRVSGNMRIWGRQELEKELLETFRSALDSSPAQLVLNLAPVTAIDTLGIAALVRVLIECSRRQMELKIIMPPGTPGEAIRCVRVFEPWPEFKSESEAVEAAKAWSAAG
jgi:anti-anti-sigma regulatory factor